MYFDKLILLKVGVLRIVSFKIPFSGIKYRHVLYIKFYIVKSTLWDRLVLTADLLHYS